ncbi:acyltransferase family protein [Cellulomonas terrae]|uniref:Acyltransferase n=1 Tax=Cellulomonas terrae TaxID=311234 RepID=A0A511JPK3_9CELL|nr:acyltransferase family protein [Cellulomonas terrae]GEL99962.1 acyltransferase [Cellulomonas terrae]
MTVTAQRPALAEQRSPRPAPAARMPYLGGLDGIRAIAVAGVVVYHLGAPWMRGGFLGVDVFFVLSGYLITTLVLDEVERTGTFAFRRFYARRARRLLPALGLLLVAMAGVAVAMPSEAAELRGDIAAAVAYASNWWQVFADRSYFEMVSRPPLLQHLWSLAIEEQFYLVFPLVVVLALRAGRARVGQVAGILALLSTVAMAVLAVRSSSPVPNDPSRVYFGTDTHSMGLLVGAAMAAAWTPWRTWDRAGSWVRERGRAVRRFEAGVTDVLGVLALLGVVAAFVWVDEFSDALYRGGFLAFSLLAAVLVGSVADPAGLLGRALGRQPWRWLGTRSYGIYLWHWPVFMLSRPGVDLDLSPWLATILRLAAVLGLAELSYRFVELPVRRGAVGRAVARVRRPHEDRARTLLRVVAAAIGLAVVGGVATAALAQVPRVGSEATSWQPEPVPAVTSQRATTPPTPTATRTPTPTPTPTPVETPPPPPPEEVGAISSIGDSVMLGAAADLAARGVVVDAVESRQFGAMLEIVRGGVAAGTLGHTVIVHGGTNGPIDEASLRELLELTRDRRVYLVNVHVPRTWAAYNNELLARVTPEYPHAHLLDWSTLGSANRPWFYADDIHLKAGGGREGYADWLVASVQP